MTVRGVRRGGGTGDRRRGRGARAGREDPAVVVRGPEELIAMIPAAVGFVPGPGSVIAVCGDTDDGRPGPIARVDVPSLMTEYGPGPGELGGEAVDPADAGPAQLVAEVCARDGITDLWLVGVHPGCLSDRAEVDRLRDALETFEVFAGLAGARVRASYAVEEIGAGRMWVETSGLGVGTQLDPLCSELAAVTAFRGQGVAGSREEVAAVYQVRDAEAVDIEPVDERMATWAEIGLAVRRHEMVARLVGSGREVDDEAVAEVARSLLDHRVRDRVAMGGLEPFDDWADEGWADERWTDVDELSEDGYDRPDVQDRVALWHRIARSRPYPQRSVALALLGWVEYEAGRGVYARCALEEALVANPSNTLAELLLTALDNGIHPSYLRQEAG